MAITDRNLKAGMVFKARYKGDVFTCEVLDDKQHEGKLVYALSGKGLRKRAYPTLGRATTAITAPKVSPNGWAWWTREADFAAGNGHKAPAQAAKPRGAVGRGIARSEAKRARKAAAKKAPAARRAARPRAERKPFACDQCGQDYAEQAGAEACLDSHRAEAEAAQEPRSQAGVPA